MQQFSISALRVTIIKTSVFIVRRFTRASVTNECYSDLTYPEATRDYTRQRVASTSADENLREEGSGHPEFPSQMPVPLPSILLFCYVMLSLPSSPSP
jgi:hypothetical protein